MAEIRSHERRRNSLKPTFWGAVLRVVRGAPRVPRGVLQCGRTQAAGRHDSRAGASLIPRCARDPAHAPPCSHAHALRFHHPHSPWQEGRKPTSDKPSRSGSVDEVSRLRCAALETICGGIGQRRERWAACMQHAHREGGQEEGICAAHMSRVGAASTFAEPIGHACVAPNSGTVA